MIGSDAKRPAEMPNIIAMFPTLVSRHRIAHCIAAPAVKRAVKVTACARAKRALFKESHPKAPHRGVPRNTKTGDPAAND